MDSSVKYQFLMSQLKPLQEIKDTEKTKLSIVFYEQTQSACVLRVCKNRDLSSVCESLRKVRNPNAAVVYDYVFYEDDTYILEENLNGKTVQEYVGQGQIFTEKETARIIIEVCKALEELHREDPPVVHNDINPSNIMLREDGSKEQGRIRPCSAQKSMPLRNIMATASQNPGRTFIVWVSPCIKC